MDNKTQNILHKFSTQKVELGLHDDMLKYEKRAEDLMSDVKKRLDAVKTSLREVVRNYEIAKGVKDDAMKMAKELGADNLISLYNKREASIEGGIREAQNIISKI